MECSHRDLRAAHRASTLRLHNTRDAFGAKQVPCIGAHTTEGALAQHGYMGKQPHGARTT